MNDRIINDLSSKTQSWWSRLEICSICPRYSRYSSLRVPARGHHIVRTYSSNSPLDLQEKTPNPSLPRDNVFIFLIQLGKFDSRNGKQTRRSKLHKQVRRYRELPNHHLLHFTGVATANYSLLEVWGGAKYSISVSSAPSEKAVVTWLLEYEILFSRKGVITRISSRWF